MTKPYREFWIFKGTSHFCSKLEYDVESGLDIKSKPDGFYDIVGVTDTIEGGLHVIEHQAYQDLKKKCDALVEALNRIKNHDGHRHSMGQDEIARQALAEYEKDIAE